MIDVILWVFRAWPYWVPVLAFAIGAAFGVRMQREQSLEQLKRLAKRIEVPEGWRDGVVSARLDGGALSRPGMAAAGLLVRSFDGHGSGVCVSSDGLVLTNAHVVGAAPVVEVDDGASSYLGVVVRVDAARDVALVKVGTRTLKPALIAADLPSVGDEVFVSGAPLRAENQGLLTRGIVSKVGPFEGASYIHTDAGVAPGNSGGPCFNGGGGVVGLTVAVQKSGEQLVPHLGLAIPIREALAKLGFAEFASPTPDPKPGTSSPRPDAPTA